MATKKDKFEKRVRNYVDNLFGVSSNAFGTTGNDSGTGFDPSQRPDDYMPTDQIDKDNEFDLIHLVDKAIDPLTGVPRDIKIPEGDFKEAKNFFDFCTNFRGSESKFPFSRQMHLMLNLYAEICPRCTPKKLLNIHNIPVDFEGREMNELVTITNYGVCPKCGGQKSDFIRNRELNEYVEMNLCIGQRAGKSTTVGAGAEYLTHKYLMYPRLAGICRGISAATPLVATFVGYRYSDAFNLLYSPIIKGIEASPWFTEYHKMLDHYGEKHGLEFYRKKDEFLRYTHKNIELWPAGPSKRGLRGRTRWLTAIDELGWFPIADAVKKGKGPADQDDDRERASADGVYDALDRSLLTIREEMSWLYQKGHNRFLQAYAMNVSSPSSQADKITRLVEENKNSDTNFALRLPTWEINPYLPRTSKRIVNAYRKDPVAAERDYGANPPLNAASFIMQEEAERAFLGPNRASVTVLTKRINDVMRQGARIETSSAPQPCPASLMSLDAGLTNNSFAVTVLQLQELQVGKIESIVVNVPVVIEIQPRKGHKLHYPMIYKNVLKPLIEQFNVRYLFADRWNSITTLDTAMEDFAATKLIADQYSVKYSDFIQTKSYVEEGKLILPKLEMDGEAIRRVDSYPEYFLGKPAAHLLFQMITVKDMGKTVIKGDAYTDDIFRALVLGVSRILDEKIKPEILKMTSLITRPRLTGAIGAGRSTPVGQISNPLHTYAIGNSQTRLLPAARPATGGNSVVIRHGRSGGF
jgi:hypothetical protein